MTASDSDLADTLGPALADPSELPGQGGKLARLGELVCFLMDRDGIDTRPLNVAAVLLADKLASAAESLQVVYRTRKAGYATRIDAVAGLPVQEPRGRTVTTRPVGAGLNWVTDLSAPIPWGGAGIRNRSVWTQPPKPKAADVAPAALRTAPVALFDSVRSHWGGQKLQRAHLFHVRNSLAYLAIPAAAAAELFGYGVEADTTQAQGAPIRPTTRPAEPLPVEPDKLAGLAVHDAEKWGAAETDDGNRRPVVRLADLVRLVGDRMGLPPKRSSAAVLDMIDGSGVSELFVFVRGDLARPVTDADLWRPRFPSGAEHCEDRRRELAGDFFRVFWSMDDDEAEWRGIVARPGYHSGLSDAEWRALVELPVLRGVAGALEMLRVVWAQRALNFASLDDGPAGGLAMLRADAVRLFGREPESAPGDLPAPVVPAAVAAPLAAVRQLAPVYAVNPILSAAKVEIQPTKKPGENWKGQAEADLLSQFEYLTSSAGGGFKAHGADDHLAAVWSVSASAIKQARLRAARRCRSESGGIDQVQAAAE